MLLGSVPKQPIEVKLVEVNFDDFIDGRACTNISVQLDVPTGITSPASLLTGTNYQFLVATGTDQNGYKIQLTVTFVIGGFPLVEQYEINVVVTEV